MADLNKIVEEIKTLTVVEVADLVKMLEEELSPIIESDKEGAEEKRFERILESASAQVPLRGKREENRPTWQQDREGGAE